MCLWIPGFLKDSVASPAFGEFSDYMLLTHANGLNLSTVKFTSWIKNNKGVLC